MGGREHSSVGGTLHSKSHKPHAQLRQGASSLRWPDEGQDKVKKYLLRSLRKVCRELVQIARTLYRHCVDPVLILHCRDLVQTL